MLYIFTGNYDMKKYLTNEDTGNREMKTSVTHNHRKLTKEDITHTRQIRTKLSYTHATEDNFLKHFIYQNKDRVNEDSEHELHNYHFKIQFSLFNLIETKYIKSASSIGLAMYFVLPI